MDDGTPIRLRVQINEEEVRRNRNTAYLLVCKAGIETALQEGLCLVKCVNLLLYRAVRCLTSQGQEQRCGGTATLHGPSPCLLLSTACAA